MIGVLVSGEGSNLQALLDAGSPSCAVASNRAGPRALERAAARRRPAAAFALDELRPTARQRDAAMADWLEEQRRRARRLRRLHAPAHAAVPRPLPRPDRQRPPLAAARRSRARARSRTRSRPASRPPASPSTSSTRASTPGRCSRQEPRPGRAARDARRADPRRRAPAAAGGGGRAVRALISVWDKTRARATFARGLADARLGARRERRHRRALEELGLAVTRVESLTELPELLGGRVKTLHPRIHAGILARRDVEADRDCARRARDRALRPRLRQPLPLRAGRARARHPRGGGRRDDRRRRPGDAARRGEELRPRRAGLPPRGLRARARRAARRRRALGRDAARARHDRLLHLRLLRGGDRLAGSRAGRRFPRSSCRRSRSSSTSPTARTRTSAPPTTPSAAPAPTCSPASSSCTGASSRTTT